MRELYEGLFGFCVHADRLRLAANAGQIAHARHAKIARRVNLSQAARIAEDPKSASHLRRPASPRGALRGRHER